MVLVGHVPAALSAAESLADGVEEAAPALRRQEGEPLPGQAFAGNQVAAGPPSGPFDGAGMAGAGVGAGEGAAGGSPFGNDSVPQ